MNAKGKRKVTKAQPLTIYDGDKYFDAKFTFDEMRKLRDRIVVEAGFDDKDEGRSWLSTHLILLSSDLGARLGIGRASHEMAVIHMCRELEIDYKSFAENAPKLPIEPFYQFVASRFPRLKPTSNEMRLDVQQHHMHLAFIDWIDAECEKIACPKSYHGLGCEDRYEEPDYMTAVQRVWKYNAARPKLTLVHSA